MIIEIVLFWSAVAILSYHLAGYGLLLYLINLIRKKKKVPAEPKLSQFPSIIVLCAAYNEEQSMDAKIQSFLELDYPKDRIKMIVVSDDSADRTNEIVTRYSDRNVELIIQKPRAGKQAAHNLALPKLDCDYVLSTDANSIFAPDAVRLLVQKMMSDIRLGMVSGELRLIKKGSKGSGEGLYWRYESFLKKLESEFKTIIGSNGSIYLIKREFFTTVDPQSVDDFERTLIVLRKGALAAYEPNALVFEEETVKAKQEISRKIRIIGPEWLVMKRNLALLNPLRYPVFSFQLISHKLLRWLFFIFVLVIYITSALLWQVWFYKVAFILQSTFYALGGFGLIMQNYGRHIPLTGMAAYFVAMVYSSAMAALNTLTKKRIQQWKPVR